MWIPPKPRAAAPRKRSRPQAQSPTSERWIDSVRIMSPLRLHLSVSTSLHSRNAFERHTLALYIRSLDREWALHGQIVYQGQVCATRQPVLSYGPFGSSIPGNILITAESSSRP